MKFPLLEISHTCESLEEILALDELLLQNVEETPDKALLIFYEWTKPAVVLGRSSKIREEVHLPNCERDGIPVTRRCSGGGVVMTGIGCLCYSLIFPTAIHAELSDITRSTRFIMSQLAAGFHNQFPSVQVQGISDLTLEGESGRKKFSGNAQRWLRHAFLHHGTILYDFDIPQLSRYLRSPDKEPDYREHRPHEEFVTNLPLSTAEIRQRISTTWNAIPGSVDIKQQSIRELIAERYQKQEWIWKR